jgi:hypothetical protein
MTILLNTGVTTAVTAAVTGTVEMFGSSRPRSLALQGTFTYGSGGTSADAYVQTSFDAGTTWSDAANFHFTTSTARFLFNLSSLTPVTTGSTSPTDGSLASNTCNDGVLGPLWRVKYTTVGTYAASTTLRVDATVDGRLTA